MDMNKHPIHKNRVLLVLAQIMAVLALCITAALLTRSLSGGTIQSLQPGGSPAGSLTYRVGDTPLSDYVIRAGFGAGSAAKKLQAYIALASDTDLEITYLQSDRAHTICLEIDKTLEEGRTGIRIDSGNITLTGRDKEDLLLRINEFANAYLGYAFAGTSEQHLLCGSSEVILPANVTDPGKDAWISQREPIICLWKTNMPRGTYYNSSTSQASEILSYSDDQLYNYVRMMKYCGYNGIQVTDMCSAWAAYGGYEFVQQRIRFMADAAHSMGMDFTLWVWGAEFNGYGWDDPDVEYYDYDISVYAKDNPDAVATFEKYSSIYAELADCTDRIIVHYVDPGHLNNSEDVVFFASMLREKFLAGNPDVDFGISCYTETLIDPNMVMEQMGSDVTLYSGTMVTADKNWPGFRTIVRDNNIPYGVWSWNLTEMEIDQLAVMNVNIHLIRDAYQRTRALDTIVTPSYWSEMDSYHVLNLFSHYCAGHLLQNPDRDVDELLYELCRDLVGDEYAEDLYRVLSIIEEARTGDRWETFRNNYSDYILLSDAYPTESILDRCQEMIPRLETLAENAPDQSSVPLPISVKELMELLQPQLAQIYEYAQFRQMLNELRELEASGADLDTVQAYLNNHWTPLHEYNTIVGTWGQAEQRAAYLLLRDHCLDAGLTMPEDPVFMHQRKMRIYEEFVTMQKQYEERYCSPKGINDAFSYGEEDDLVLLQEMVDEGLLSQTSDGSFYLTDWENYRYHTK